METVLIVVHLLIVIALAGVVMLQRSEGGGLGAGASPSAFMSGRGQTNLLSRTTAILGAGFFATSLALAVVATRSAPTTPALLAPAASQPGAPSAPAGSNVLEQLQQLQNQNAPPKAP